MKKNFWYIMLLVFFISAVSFVIVKYKNKQEAENNMTYPLLTRKDNSTTAEWLAAKKNTDYLINKIKRDPGDTRSAIALANTYITEGRITGNTVYYDNAAMKTVDNVLIKEPGNYEALLLKSLLQLSQHHFAEGLATANIAVNINPHNAFVYGLLVDANVEMGNYDAALDAADKMVTIRPDLRSYSRIAYLREIYGDYPGAINAMRLAIAAGVPGEESTEWCRMQLGRLYENIGDISKAAFQYNLSLAARPGYAYAFAGLGRIASYQKKYDSAVYYYRQAQHFISDLSIKENLATAYRYAGQNETANSLSREVMNEMKKNVQLGIDDPTAGHYSDKELADAYLQNGDYDKALAHALAEYNRRPKNIDVNEVMARVYYKRNEIDKALTCAEAALATNSKDPQLLCTAGLIYSKTGNREKGKMMLKQALQQNPVIPEGLKKECTETLQKL